MSIKGQHNLIKQNLEKYDKKTFLREIYQNIEDIGAERIQIHYIKGNQHSTDRILKFDRLLIINDKCVRWRDVEPLSEFGESGKDKDSQKIGKFGLGLKSVCNYADAYLVFARYEVEDAEMFLGNKENQYSNQHIVIPEKRIFSCLFDATCLEFEDDVKTYFGKWKERKPKVSEEYLSKIPIRSDEGKWFCLWVPLRPENLKDYRVSPVTQNHLGVSDLRDMLATSLFNLQNLKSIKEIVFYVDGVEKTVIRNCFKSNSLSKEITMDYAGENKEVYKCYAKDITLNSNEVDIFKNNDDWPRRRIYKNEALESDLVPFEPHKGICLSLQIRDDVPMHSLRVSYACVLPFAESENEQEDVFTAQMLISGGFFPDSGRKHMKKRLENEETVETKYNEFLVEQALSNIPEFLFDATKSQTFKSTAMDSTIRQIEKWWRNKMEPLAKRHLLSKKQLYFQPKLFKNGNCYSEIQCDDAKAVIFVMPPTKNYNRLFSLFPSLSETDRFCICGEPCLIESTKINMPRLEIKEQLDKEDLEYLESVVEDYQEKNDFIASIQEYLDASVKYEGDIRWIFEKYKDCAFVSRRLLTYRKKANIKINQLLVDAEMIKKSELVVAGGMKISTENSIQFLRLIPHEKISEDESNLLVEEILSCSETSDKEVLNCKCIRYNNEIYSLADLREEGTIVVKKSEKNIISKLLLVSVSKKKRVVALSASLSKFFENLPLEKTIFNVLDLVQTVDISKYRKEIDELIGELDLSLRRSNLQEQGQFSGIFGLLLTGKKNGVVVRREESKIQDEVKNILDDIGYSVMNPDLEREWSKHYGVEVIEARGVIELTSESIKKVISGKIPKYRIIPDSIELDDETAKVIYDVVRMELPVIKYMGEEFFIQKQQEKYFTFEYGQTIEIKASAVISILNNIADHQDGIIDKKVFNTYLNEYQKNDPNHEFLAKIHLLLNQTGEWVSPKILCAIDSGEIGFEKNILDSDQKNILRLKEKARCESTNLEKFEADSYFAGWDAKISKEVYSLLLLASNMKEDRLSEITRSVMTQIRWRDIVPESKRTLVFKEIVAHQFLHSTKTIGDNDFGEEVLNLIRESGVTIDQVEYSVAIADESFINILGEIISVEFGTNLIASLNSGIVFRKINIESISPDELMEIVVENLFLILKAHGTTDLLKDVLTCDDYYKSNIGKAMGKYFYGDTADPKRNVDGQIAAIQTFCEKMFEPDRQKIAHYVDQCNDISFTKIRKYHEESIINIAELICRNALKTNPKTKKVLELIDSVMNIRSLNDGEKEEDKSILKTAKLKSELYRELSINSEIKGIFSKGMRRIIENSQYNASSIPYEMFQNADDAYMDYYDSCFSGEVTINDCSFIIIYEEAKYICFKHVGRGFNEIPKREIDRFQLDRYRSDWSGVLKLYASEKELAENNTGKFGLGFKSVYCITDSPIIVTKGKIVEISGTIFPVIRKEFKEVEFDRDDVVVYCEYVAGVPDVSLEKFIHDIPMLAAFSQRINCVAINHSIKICIKKDFTKTIQLFDVKNENYACINIEPERNVKLMFKYCFDNNEFKIVHIRETYVYWNVSPIEGSNNGNMASDLKFIFNAKFELDPGRKHFSATKEDKNIEIFRNSVDKIVVGLEEFIKEANVKNNVQYWKEIYSVFADGDVIQSDRYWEELMFMENGVVKQLSQHETLPTINNLLVNHSDNLYAVANDLEKLILKYFEKGLVIDGVNVILGNMVSNEISALLRFKLKSITMLDLLKQGTDSNYQLAPNPSDEYVGFLMEIASDESQHQYMKKLSVNGVPLSDIDSNAIDISYSKLQKVLELFKTKRKYDYSAIEQKEARIFELMKMVNSTNENINEEEDCEDEESPLDIGESIRLWNELPDEFKRSKIMDYNFRLHYEYDNMCAGLLAKEKTAYYQLLLRSALEFFGRHPDTAKNNFIRYAKNEHILCPDDDLSNIVSFFDKEENLNSFKSFQMLARLLVLSLYSKDMLKYVDHFTNPETKLLEFFKPSTAREAIPLKPLDQLLGTGKHFFIRELIRLSIIKRQGFARTCYVPNKKVCAWCGVEYNQNPSEKSYQIYNKIHEAIPSFDDFLVDGVPQFDVALRIMKEENII